MLFWNGILSLRKKFHDRSQEINFVFYNNRGWETLNTYININVQTPSKQIYKMANRHSCLIMFVNKDRSIQYTSNNNIKSRLAAQLLPLSRIRALYWFIGLLRKAIPLWTNTILSAAYNRGRSCVRLFLISGRLMKAKCGIGRVYNKLQRNAFLTTHQWIVYGLGSAKCSLRLISWLFERLWNRKGSWRETHSRFAVRYECFFSFYACIPFYIKSSWNGSAKRTGCTS